MADALTPGQRVACCGYVTRLIFVLNQPPGELETRLGYSAGRLATGWALLALMDTVKGNEFRFAGYSYFSGGRIGHPRLGMDRPQVHDELMQKIGDPTGYADKFAAENLQTTGSERIVKIVPMTDVDASLTEDQQYPVGSGVPQWVLTVPKNFIVVAVVGNGMKHLGGGVDLPPGFWVDPSVAKSLR